MAHPDVERLSPEALRELRAHEGEVIALYVRTRDARAVHPYEIPGTRWLPLADVVTSASNLDPNAKIAAYCT